MSQALTVEVAVRGGEVITASDRYVADIGVSAGKIVQIGGEFNADLEIDAYGKLVLPGGIDAHVHLTPAILADGEIRWADDFESGTMAAAAGGITTVGNMTHPHPEEGLLEAAHREVQLAEQSALVDFFLHPVLLDPSSKIIEQLPQLADEGHTSLKIYMVFSNFDGQSARFLEAMRVAGENGMVPLVHCEDGCIIGHLIERLVRSEKTGPEHYPASRPVFSEEAAVSRAIGFAEAAGSPVYIVHLSSASALEACHRARARGIPVYVETRPLYLYLTQERFYEADGAKYTGQPPLRAEKDVEALWNGLWSGDVQTFCTDHAPWTLDEKVDPKLDVGSFKPGVADLDTLLPMLFSEGVNGGRISAQRFVELTSTNAARLFGMFPRKGTIAVGSDADLVVWDSERSRSISSEQTQTRADFSPYEGWQVSGWPVLTLSRGEIVYKEGEIVGEVGWGNVVRRDRGQLL